MAGDGLWDGFIDCELLDKDMLKYALRQDTSASDVPMTVQSQIPAELRV